MRLLAVSQSNGNAFWSVLDGTNFDYDFVEFADAVTGDSWWGCDVPINLATTPAWNLKLYHKAASGAGGNVVLTVDALDRPTAAAFDSALTSLHASATFTVETSANLTITTLSGTNYDGTEAIAASNFLVVHIARVGGSGSDTVNAAWRLIQVVLRCDVN